MRAITIILSGLALAGLAGCMDPEDQPRTGAQMPTSEVEVVALDASTGAGTPRSQTGDGAQDTPESDGLHNDGGSRQADRPASEMTSAPSG